MINQYTLLFELLKPASALVLGALFVLALDLSVGRHQSHAWRLGGAVAAGIASLMASAHFVVNGIHHQPWLHEPAGVKMQAELGFSATYNCATAQIVVIALAFLTLLLVAGTSRMKNPAEHVALTLFAATGFLLMVAAQNLLVIFAAFELSSLSLYILAGFDKTNRESAEAGLKYFLYGGTAAAFLLFGFSLLYGLTGEIQLPALAAKLAQTPPSPLLLVAFAMVLAGFGYKVAAAPFHIWAPDAYQGAPVTSAALIASASKVAGFVLLARVVSVFWRTLDRDGSWFTVFVLLAVASLLLGNIVALVQKNIRRLLAYSAIAHAGVLLIATLVAGAPRSLDGSGEQHLFYYLLTYGLATIGAFGVLAVLEHNGHPAQNIRDLTGLWKRSPLLGGTLFVFILSLAGVPPLGGFMAKFFVFRDALALGQASDAPLGNALFWLVILAIAMTVPALFYYLQILRQSFVADDTANAETTPLRVPTVTAFALLFSAVSLVLLGVLGG